MVVSGQERAGSRIPIFGIISAVMGMVETFKDLLKLADSVNNLDLYKKVVELQDSVIELQEENRLLKETIGKMDERQDVVSYLVEQLDGPFCMRCWDADGSCCAWKCPHTPETRGTSSQTVESANRL